MLDLTIPLDDALTERFMACLVCGQREGARYLDLLVIHGLPLSRWRGACRVRAKIRRQRSSSPGWLSVSARHSRRLTYGRKY